MNATDAAGAGQSVLPSGSALRTFGWTVRRELWENRSVYIAPLAAAGLLMLGFAVSLVTMPDRLDRALALSGAARHEAILEPHMFAALLLMGTGVVVAIFYSLDALYAERRDRSILFWKSLPVSDATTVLAKATIPLVILPLLTTAATIVVQLAMLLLGSAALWFGGTSAAPLWQEVAPLSMATMLLYHVLTIHILWYAPFFAWLLLASAWARRAPFLWAGIPLLAVGVIEKVALGSTQFADMLRYRFVGGPATLTGTSEMPIDPLTHVTPGVFLSSPALWVGLAMAALFLAAAARIRRHRGPA